MSFIVDVLGDCPLVDENEKSLVHLSQQDLDDFVGTDVPFLGHHEKEKDMHHAVELGKITFMKDGKGKVRFNNTLQSQCIMDQVYKGHEVRVSLGHKPVNLDGSKKPLHVAIVSDPGRPGAKIHYIGNPSGNGTATQQQQSLNNTTPSSSLTKTLPTNIMSAPGVPMEVMASANPPPAAESAPATTQQQQSTLPAVEIKYEDLQRFILGGSQAAAAPQQNVAPTPSFEENTRRALEEATRRAEDAERQLNAVRASSNEMANIMTKSLTERAVGLFGQEGADKLDLKNIAPASYSTVNYLLDEVHAARTTFRARTEAEERRAANRTDTPYNPRQAQVGNEQMLPPTVGESATAGSNIPPAATAFANFTSSREIAPGRNIRVTDLPASMFAEFKMN